LSKQDIVHSEPFILASGSKIRKKILSDHRINFVVQKSEVDEEELKKNILNLPFEERVIKLASAKAKEISEINLERYVVGADQMCVSNGRVFNKPGNLENAINNLKLLAGNTHCQYSGISIFLNGKSLWTFCDTATLTMKELSDEQIMSYVLEDEPYECCGSYKYESLGATLFSKVKGSEYTVQGLAFVPLINAFKELGISL
jgi:septum formation protein|tara:strand:+ start:177 stop:782 length:606 start_codon:yes stop_codon:yes gene_type:complete